MELVELAAAVRAALPDVLLALDFDGTLAPIVTDPADSRPLPGALAALRTLAGRGAQVAVITGREAQTVLALGGLAAVPRLVIEGLYGAETWQGGMLSTPAPPAAIDVLRRRLPAVLRAAGADPRVWIEDKRLSLVVHGRRAGAAEAALDPLRAPIAGLAAELGLEVHPGRGVLELRLPGPDKAGALRRLVAHSGAQAVLFAGDDLGDLPAFAEIRALRAAGLLAWSVGVSSAEVPQVAAAADVEVDGPAGVLELLLAIVG